MNEAIPVFYHGARAKLSAHSGIHPRYGFAWLSPSLDAAIWAAELDEGEEQPRVYRVAPTNDVEDTAERADFVRPPHPSMSWRTRGALVVIAEVTEWQHFHGTKAALRPGDRIAPGHSANFGPAPRRANYVYFTRTLDASVWGAELAAGEGPGRVYLVEPTGPFEDDPNLSNQRFRGNPSKSFRSRDPLRVVAEFAEWEGHPPEVVRAMKEGLARLNAAGVEPNDG